MAAREGQGASSAATDCAVYVSNADSAEISVLRLDAANGALSLLQTMPVSGSVFPLALTPDRRFLYAALRPPSPSVASFRIDPATRLLTAIGIHALPDGMCHISTDRSGRYLFAASYSDHRMSVSAISDDGVAGAATHVLPTGRHAHATLVDPSNRYLFVSNLGADAVMQLRFDAASGSLMPNEPPTFRVRPKAGPRHLVFHPNARFVYLLNELDASVDVLAFDASSGTLSLLQTQSTLPPGFNAKPWSADLHLTPDGRFLYTSERSSSSLAAFRVDASSGRIEPLSHTTTESQPRGFNIDPSGRWLVAVGQLSHAATAYAIDPDNGSLTPVSSLPVGRNPNWVEIVEMTSHSQSADPRAQSSSGS
jgi:6-phosphogluconolactonase